MESGRTGSFSKPCDWQQALAPRIENNNIRQYVTTDLRIISREDTIFCRFAGCLGNEKNGFTYFGTLAAAFGLSFASRSEVCFASGGIGGG